MLDKGMSAVASFTLISKNKIEKLKESAVVTNGLFGDRKDNFHSFLQGNGELLGDYGWSGYVFATLIPYLSKEGIELDSSEFAELSNFISNVRGVSCFVLTNLERDAIGDKLNPSHFSEVDLRNYFESFNATKFEDAGKAMMDAISLTRESLQRVDADSIILLMIG